MRYLAFIVIVLFAAVPACAQVPATPVPAPPTLLHFHAPWCIPCREAQPIVDRLKSDGYRVQEVNVDIDHPKVVKYRVLSIPAYVIVVDGREVARFVGKVTIETLKTAMRAAALPVHVVVRHHKAKR